MKKRENRWMNKIKRIRMRKRLKKLLKKRARGRRIKESKLSNHHLLSKEQEI